MELGRTNPANVSGDYDSESRHRFSGRSRGAQMRQRNVAPLAAGTRKFNTVKICFLGLSTAPRSTWGSRPRREGVRARFPFMSASRT